MVPGTMLGSVVRSSVRANDRAPSLLLDDTRRHNSRDCLLNAADGFETHESHGER